MNSKFLTTRGIKSALLDLIKGDNSFPEDESYDCKSLKLKILNECTPQDYMRCKEYKGNLRYCFKCKYRKN